MDIRNQLTLELITTLYPTETIPYFTGPLAYLPDGRSIARASDTAIIIWDVQMGGVAKEIKCSANNVSLVWSSDGWTICTINSKDRGAFTVHMYDASSGTTLSSVTIRSQDIPHLWTDDESFRVMTTAQVERLSCAINISKVGSTLTNTRSFTLPLGNTTVIGSFSPTAHRISTSGDSKLCILDIQSSNCLLDEPLQFSSHCFSSDGSHFAAHLRQIKIYVWEYHSGRYVLLGEFECHRSILHLRFSPTPSSILGCTGHGILQVWRLHELPTSSETHWQYMGLSRSWTHIATAHPLENTITITDLLAQNPPQFIDTNVEIEGMVITGSVLLVAGSRQLVAWLLTEDGLVDGVIGDRRVDCSDSIWAISKSIRDPQWEFWVKGQVGFIMPPRHAPYVYDTETGGVLPAKASQYYGSFALVNDLCFGWRYLQFQNLSGHGIPSGDSWQISEATLRGGWVKDAEGKHRLWVPTEWRTDWDPADWRHDVTTQFGHLGGRAVVIKF